MEHGKKVKVLLLGIVLAGSASLRAEAQTCGEASCVPPQGAYISHFTGPGCTGTESYYLPYDGYAYNCRPWDGGGQCGTIQRTVTNISYRYNGNCYDAWPSGNTLSQFVTVYRGAVGCITDTCSTCSRPSFGVDSDVDGVPDSLEYDLAHAFFPSVILKNVESDLQQAYLYRGKATPYTVQPLSPRGICNEAFKCLEIKFALPYVRDYGDSIFSGHLGDSEFYAMVVMRTQSWPSAQSGAGSWQVIRDFTAAHWGTSVDSSAYGAYGNCPNNYAGYCSGIPNPASGERDCFHLNTFEWCGSAGCTWTFSCGIVGCYSGQPLLSYPTLYASEKKHATYHSDSECDHGGFQWPWGEGEDECPATNLYSLRSFKGELLQNVGSSSHHTIDTVMQHPDLCGTYDVWGNQGFGNSTSYTQNFNTTLAWCL